MSKDSVLQNRLTRAKSPLAKAIVMELSAQKRSVSCLYVKLSEKPVKKDDGAFFDDDIRVTSGYYYLAYRPVGFYNDVAIPHPQDPFLIVSDLFVNSKRRIRVSGYKELVKKAETIPEVKWILRNTTISKMHFTLAKGNIGIQFPFGIKFSSYVKKAGTKYSPYALLQYERYREVKRAKMRIPKADMERLTVHIEDEEEKKEKPRLKGLN